MGVHLQENQSLKEHHTFGIQVYAKWYSSFGSEADLYELLALPLAEKEKLLILGQGSNILPVGDFNGLVMKNEIKGITLIGEDQDYFFVRAAGGEIWHSFVLTCIENGWSGVENLSFIPGSVGACPIQNIGAYGVEIKDVVESLEAVHIREKTKRVFLLNECLFGYRDSIFKREEKGHWIITAVTFRLRKQPIFHVSYGSIEEELKKAAITTLTIRAISDAVIRIRRAKLPDPSQVGNAGSFFKNPVVDSFQFERIKAYHPDIPTYRSHTGEIKIPAGWLIEKAGWKGKRFGACGVHQQQALVLVNFGGASGKEILQLSENIIIDIKDQFGIELEREVNIV